MDKNKFCVQLARLSANYDVILSQTKVDVFYLEIQKLMTYEGFEMAITAIFSDPKVFVKVGSIPTIQQIFAHCPNYEKIENKIKIVETQAIMRAKNVFWNFEQYLNSNYGLDKEKMRSTLPPMKSKTLKFIENYFGGIEKMLDWLCDYTNYALSKMKEIEKDFVKFWVEETRKEFEEKMNLPKIEYQKNLLLQ